MTEDTGLDRLVLCIMFWMELNIPFLTPPTIFSATLLVAQQYDTGPTIEYCVGIKSATGSTLLGDLTDSTPSAGVVAEMRGYFGKSRFAFGAKASFDNWGNQHLKGTPDDRSEVKRFAGTAGFLYMLDPSREGLYFRCEAGVAQWHIESTYAPLADFRVNKGVAGLFFGYNFRRTFVEAGAELSSWEKTSRY